LYPLVVHSSNWISRLPRNVADWDTPKFLVNYHTQPQNTTIGFYLWEERFHVEWLFDIVYQADLHVSNKKKQNARTMDSSAGFFIILLDPPSRETN
jgi:hypothetical protein